MKVLEKKDWTNVFSYVCNCPQCESKLEIESNDLTHQPGSGGNAHDYCPESFFATCTVCWQKIGIDVKLIPPYIQKLARARLATDDR